MLHIAKTPTLHSIAGIEKLSKLKQLDLNYCLALQDISKITQLPNLESIHIEGNTLSQYLNTLMQEHSDFFPKLALRPEKNARKYQD